MLSTFLRITAAVSFILSVAWIYSEPRKFDGWIAAGASLITFAALFGAERRKASSSQSPQEQTVGAKGYGIQAGRDVHIASSHPNDDAR